MKIIRYENVSFSFDENTIVKDFNQNVMQKDKILLKGISGMI